MRIKCLFMCYGLVLALSALILPTTTFATGEENVVPEHSQEDGTSDNTASQPSDTVDGFLTGGGANNTTSQPEVPDQTEAPSISGSVAQPEDPQNANSTPNTPKPITSPVSTNNPKPQTQVVNPKDKTDKIVQSATQLEPVSTSVEDDATIIIPAAPNDNVAPNTTVEAPHTGKIDETQATPANPLAILLLIVAGITILAAGIFSTWLSHADKRKRSAA